jgi:hypothetical protein
VGIVPELDHYAVLYLVTLALHLALVSFPLGGTVLLCLFEIFRAEEITHLRDVISEQLAIALGLAITAGVAPLLFLELVHPHAFAHAGAILGPWRPLLILPAAFAFYLAYLQGTATFRRWPGILRLPVRLGGLAGMCAVAVVLTISRRVGEQAELWRRRWTEFSFEAQFWDALPFLGIALAAATIGCAIGTLWLLGRAERRGRLSPGQRYAAEEALLRLVIPVTIGLAIVCEVLRARHDPEIPVDADWWTLRGALFATVAGFGIRLHRVGPGRLLATLGGAVALSIALLLREEQRWERLGEALDRSTREIAATRGGLAAAIASFVIAATGIGLVLKTIRAAPPRPGPAEEEEEPVEGIR